MGLSDMVTCPPLCIIQARYGATRLPGKMCLDLGGETLIARAVRIARQAFGVEHVVVACPASDRESALGTELARLNVRTYWHDGDPRDLLGRFHECAHLYRWHAQAVIVRYTPDDPFKTVEALRRVASGERLPVELGGEAFTLNTLGRAQALTAPDDWGAREHLTNNLVLFPTDPPPCPPGEGWTVDDMADLDAARAILKHTHAAIHDHAGSPYGRGTGDLHDPQMGELIR